MQPGDETYDLLAAVSSELATSYPETRDWDGSPFKWMLSVPSATRGKIGRDLVATWAAEAGFVVGIEYRNNQPYLIVNGARVVVKTSTLWRSGVYRFQQIKDRDYDFCLCLGISPNQVHAWLIPKFVLDAEVIGHRGQHTGAGASETSWIHAGPNSGSTWLEPYGDSLDDAGEILASQTS
jgi:hypothetical protein